MVKKVKAWAYKCEQCGWRKIIQVDVARPVQVDVSVCPKCDSQYIRMQTLTPTEVISEKLLQVILGKN